MNENNTTIIVTSIEKFKRNENIFRMYKSRF